MSSLTRKVSAQSSFTAAVLTVSDSSAQGKQVDLSGPAVAAVLAKKNFQIVTAEVVADDQALIRKTLMRLAGKARLVITTGGTGVSPRDVTPDATRSVCKYLIDGIAERIRIEGTKKTRFAALSRGVCGVRGKSIILNLPGNPKGAAESLQSVIDLMPHALQLLSGNTKHS